MRRGECQFRFHSESENEVSTSDGKKFAEVTPILRKLDEDELSKENYRPVSVLSHAFKILERIVFDQMNNLFFKSKFLPVSTGFSKNHRKKCVAKYD